MRDLILQLSKSSIYSTKPRDGNVSSLASLLRYSSTIWRIEGDVKNEIKYLKDCRGFLGDKTSINNTLIVTDYIDARLEDLESLDNV